MDTTLRSTLDALRDQRSHAESEVDALRITLANAEQRLTYIRGAIENIEPLVGDAPSEGIDDAEVIDADIVDDEGETLPVPGNVDADDRELDRSPYFSFSVNDARQRTRTPSTEWIAEIVNEAGRVISRDHVFSIFEERHGFPATWTSPRNSLGNAINRAAARGWIQRLDAHHFAPRGYEPAGARSLSDAGGQ